MYFDIHYHIKENNDIFWIKLILVLHQMFHQAIVKVFYQILNLIEFQFLYKNDQMNEQKDHEELKILDHDLMLEEILERIHELYQSIMYLMDEKVEYQYFHLKIYQLYRSICN